MLMCLYLCLSETPFPLGIHGCRLKMKKITFIHSKFCQQLDKSFKEASTHTKWAT